MAPCCWQVRLLREELASAQEAAAAAAGHAKQYEALAASSDEAFKAMKVQQRAQVEPKDLSSLHSLSAMKSSPAH